MNFQFDKGRVKIGKHSLSNLALAEVFATGLFGILTIVLGWSAYKDARMHFAWNGALRSYASGGVPSAELATANAHRPEFAPIHELIAKIAVNAGDLETARAECEILQRLDQNSEAANVTMGVIALKTYDKTKQEPLLNQAKAFFAAAGSSADAKVGTGHVLLRRGDLDGAWKSFEAALATDPPCSQDAMSDLYIGEAAIYVKRANPVAARESFERAIFLTPSWDRGFANRGYLLARQMAEMPPLDREKFRQSAQAWTEFATTLGTMYNVNKEGRAYFRDVILTYLDAYGCLALRSLELGEAAGKLNLLRGVDSTIKRPTLNYLSTMATVIYNKSLTVDERRLYLSGLGSVAENAFVAHKDLSHRERAVIYQYLAVHGALEGANLGASVRNAEKAMEEYGSCGEELPLKAMILRVKAVALWKQRTWANQTEQPKLIEEARAAGKASLEADGDQQDLRDWLARMEQK